MKITVRQPDDFHLHLRDVPFMPAVLAHTARVFARAIIMPNLKPALTSPELVQSYRNRIETALRDQQIQSFTPLMTLYLTQAADRSIVKNLKNSGITAVKLYPSGATTHSDSGVHDIPAMYPFFEEMQKEDVPLSIHCEVTDPGCDIFDREKVFIDRYLSPLHKEFPSLRVILEHATTKEAVQFILAAGPSVAATITPHHLMINRNDIFRQGLNPHHYCLPVAKTAADQEALIQAAVSGNSKFFAGTDSAPHPKSAKENAKGSAGIYNAWNAAGFYAEVFEKAGALNNNEYRLFEKFISENGAAFYRLPLNEGKITLEKKEFTAPDSFPYHDQTLIPFRAGEKLSWQVLHRF